MLEEILGGDDPYAPWSARRAARCRLSRQDVGARAGRQELRWPQQTRKRAISVMVTEMIT